MKQAWCKGLPASILLLFLLSLSPVYAQQEQTQASDWFVQQQQQFTQYTGANKQQFGHYRHQADAEFARWLQQQWQEFEGFNALIRDPSPKPIVQPNVQGKSDSKPVVTKLKPGHKTAEPNLPSARALPRIGDPGIEYATAGKNIALKTGFYGEVIKLQLPKVIPMVLLEPLSAKSLGSAWQRMASWPYEPLLLQLQNTRTRKQMSDWALLQWLLSWHTAYFTEQHGSQVAEAQNQAQLWSWFWAYKLGLDVRPGIVKAVHSNSSPNVLKLLYQSQQTIYGQVYYQLEGHRYYPVQGADVVATEGQAPPLFSYPQGFTAAQPPQALDMSFSEIFNSGQWLTLTKTKLPLNLARIAYLENYPQLDLDYYFSAPLPAPLLQYFRETFARELLDRSPRQRLNFLLHWVQNYGKYETDQQQFQRENYILPEELLYYRKSDCEDRSFLFARLVTEVLGVDSIGLNYPGHVATAVRLSDVKNAGQQEKPIRQNDVATGSPNSKNIGSTLNYKGRRYIVADPTYLGADVGMVMPKYWQTEVKILTF